MRGESPEEGIQNRHLRLGCVLALWDFLIEPPEGMTVAVEVKAGSAVGLVPYMGEQVLRFGEQLWTVPCLAG